MIKYKIMKKLFYLLVSVALLFGASYAVAAQTVNTETRKVDSRSIFFKGDFFVGIGGGPSVYFGEQDRAMKFHHRLAPAMDVYVGKWIIPCLGVRVNYSGGRAFGATNADTGWVYSTGEVYDHFPENGTKALYKQRFNYFGIRGDVMFNITTLALGHNPDRLYDFSFYGGLGICKVYDELEASRFALSFGIYNQFRISKCLDAVLDIHCTGVPEDFEHETGSRPGVDPYGLYSHDGIMTAAVGICYNF